MDLRRRTTHALACAGALLIVAGLSVGGGVALAVPGPAAQPPAQATKATSSDSQSADDHSGGRRSSDRKKNRRSRNNQSGNNSTGDNSGTTDSNGTGGTTDSSGSNGSGDSMSPTPTSTTPTTTPPSTTPPSTTATTRPTATTAPPTTATTTPPTTEGTEPAPAETTPTESDGQSNGQYNGAPYQATEAPSDESTTTTAGPARGAKVPVARSGSGQPPGGDPSDPSDPSDPANTPDYSSSVPAARSANSTPAFPQPAPVVTAESQRPTQPAANPATAGASGGVSSEPATESAPGSEVSGAGAARHDSGAASQHGQELVVTGDATRRLILFGGVALLLGAVVVAFTGRERQRLVAASLPVGPARRPGPRKEIDGWEDGIPLAPAKRELARNRLGISGDSYYDDELEV